MDRITYKNAGVDVNKADKLVKHLGIGGYGAVMPFYGEGTRRSMSANMHFYYRDYGPQQF